MAPFYGWGSTASRLEPLRRGSLLFTTIVNTSIVNTSIVNQLNAGKIDSNQIQGGSFDGQYFWFKVPTHMSNLISLSE